MKLILFILLLFFAGFTYFIVSYTNKEINDLRSHGASVNAVEVESGVKNTLSTEIVDSSASSGKFISLGMGPATAPTPTPCVGIGCPTSGTPTPTPTLSQQWQLLGTHPDASVEETSLAKQLRTLIAYNGKIYSGYGDYGANTGPVALRSFDPVTKVFTKEWTANTEAISNFRIIRNKLYAPSTDRMTSADYAVGTPWKDIASLNVTHAYDMVTLTGSDLWLVGSQGTAACAWRSLDDGATWTRSICELKASTVVNDFARYYFAGVLAGKLYVQAYDYYGYAHPKSKVFNGATWSDGPSLIPSFGLGWRPLEFAGKLIYRSYEGSGTVTLFDGTSWAFVPSPTGKAQFYGTDIVQDGSTLYVLTSKELFKTTNLTNWTLITNTVPTTARSLAVLNGKFYIGTSDSKIYVFNP